MLRLEVFDFAEKTQEGREKVQGQDVKCVEHDSPLRQMHLCRSMQRFVNKLTVYGGLVSAYAQAMRR